MSRSSVAWKPWFGASSLGPALERVAQAPFLLAVRDGFTWGFGALIVACAVLFFFVGLPAAFLPAFGVMSCALALSTPFALARRAHYHPAVVVLASAAAFALIAPRPFGPDLLTYLRLLGTTGIFLALLATAVVGAGIALSRRSLGAAIALALLAAVVFGAHVDVSHAIALALQPMARLGDSFPALLAIVAAQSLLWCIGVHGPAMFAAVLTPVYLTMQMQNTAAYSAHHALPHLVVASLFLFVYPGGSGATLPLALLLAVSRVTRLRRLGRAVLLPAAANVNEPLLFGLPVVLNPFFVAPFVAAPLVLAGITYAAIALGFVARPAFYVPTLVPAPISTYLATLDPRAPLLVLVNLAVATLIYLPFVRAYEKRYGNA
ncbi:MAG TPA: PTS transporter subunit EIIC [Candidatus Dormibacteraeota bacterium]|nr:PTS transporter subunit EIIC [Candidatus Dormibacteraeota bacterium]